MLTVALQLGVRSTGIKRTMKNRAGILCQWSKSKKLARNSLKNCKFTTLSKQRGIGDNFLSSLPPHYSSVLSHCTFLAVGRRRHLRLYSNKSEKQNQQPFDNWNSNDSDWSKCLPRRASLFVQLARAHKPIGSWLLVLPCWWGTALATQPQHLPNLKLLGLFLVGSVVMRGAGCTINDLWDRDIDGKVERTRNRPLVVKDGISVPQVVAAEESFHDPSTKIHSPSFWNDDNKNLPSSFIRHWDFLDFNLHVGLGCYTI
mmetsp:Transcript_47290/g.75956  ORF Transcript_47290/g.75956 Transcript_47290/m.75956 type:complete len:258 (+) Transcript_47290:243-1016(+)